MWPQEAVKRRHSSAIMHQASLHVAFSPWPTAFATAILTFATDGKAKQNWLYSVCSSAVGRAVVLLRHDSLKRECLRMLRCGKKARFAEASEADVAKSVKNAVPKEINN